MVRALRSRWLKGQIACAVCLSCLFALPADAQPRGNRLLPRYVTVGPPDQAEGRRVMEEFRQLGLPGDYYLEFVLEILPRRGERSRVPGRLWGSRTHEGPVSRLALHLLNGSNERLLVSSGTNANIWQWTPGDGVERMPLEEVLDPLAGSHATPFDLQMPFVHWPEYVFEGVTRVRGRTAHAFLLYPPGDFAKAHPNVGGVRIYLDLQFHALMQAVVLDVDEQPLRTLTVLDLKKVDDQWIVKTIDIRDDATRDKTRFRVTGAALGIDFSAGLFTPDALNDPVASPDRVQHFD